MAIIERLFSPGATITAASSAATTSPRIPYGRFSGGGVIIAATAGATQIKWHASATAEGTPVQIYVDGAAVTTAVTVGAHPIPEGCFGFAYVAPIIVGAASCDLTVTVKG
jgi:hypothetical protein